MRHGFILIDKPLGPTSHDAVATVRRVLAEKKIGHLGTLDPLASGLLVLAVGSKALKIVELFSKLSKEYEALVKLGAVSTTYDAAGVVEEVPLKSGNEPPTDVNLRQVVAQRFVGTIEQVPPAHSAIRVSGQRAYDIARKGGTPELAARTIEIQKCEVLSYEYPNVRLKVACGAGTYIRSLAHDLGSVLRTGGYLAELRRTKVGEWDVKDACKPEDAAWTRVIPMKDLLTEYPRIDVTQEEMKKISYGQGIIRDIREGTIAWFEDLPVALVEPARDGSREARPRKVF
jgi:tRNA pseudouridine55 synthase